MFRPGISLGGGKRWRAREEGIFSRSGLAIFRTEIRREQIALVQTVLQAVSFSSVSRHLPVLEQELGLFQEQGTHPGFGGVPFSFSLKNPPHLPSCSI